MFFSRKCERISRSPSFFFLRESERISGVLVFFSLKCKRILGCRVSFSQRICRDLLLKSERISGSPSVFILEKVKVLKITEFSRVFVLENLWES